MDKLVKRIQMIVLDHHDDYNDCCGDEDDVPTVIILQTQNPNT